MLRFNRLLAVCRHFRPLGVHAFLEVILRLIIVQEIPRPLWTIFIPCALIYAVYYLRPLIRW